MENSGSAYGDGFSCETASVESWPRDKVRVVVETDAEEILNSLDVEDRIKGLNEHEVIEAMDINKTRTRAAIAT